jgi:lysozyme
MKISDNGLAIVKAFEGCLKPVPGMPGHFKPYHCPANVLTVGYGHTNHHAPRFDAGAIWTQAQCDAVLRDDMGVFERHVEKHAPGLKQHQFDALVSWSFNCGGPAGSAVWTYARQGDAGAVRARLARWNKGGGRVLPGLVRRREAEADLFEGKIDEALRTAGAIRAKARPDAAAGRSAEAARQRGRPPGEARECRRRGRHCARHRRHADSAGRWRLGRGCRVRHRARRRHRRRRHLRRGQEEPRIHRRLGLKENPMSILIFAASALLVAAAVVRIAVRYRASAGTTWQRIIHTAEGSATVLWAYVTAAGGFALQLAGQGADVLEMPGVKDQIQALLEPEWVGSFLFLVGMVTLLARLRTLLAKDGA